MCFRQHNLHLTVTHMHAKKIGVNAQVCVHSHTGSHYFGFIWTFPHLVILPGSILWPPQGRAQWWIKFHFQHSWILLSLTAERPAPVTSAWVAGVFCRDWQWVWKKRCRSLPYWVKFVWPGSSDCLSAWSFQSVTASAWVAGVFCQEWRWVWKRGACLYRTGSNFSDLGPVTVLEWLGFSVKIDNGCEKRV